MALTAPTPITTPPTAPTRSSPSTFATRADAWLAWEEAAVAEFDLAASDTYDNAVDALASATAAQGSADDAADSVAAALASEQAAASSASAAATSAGAALWVSGNNYAVGDARRSPANAYVYRCTATATGRTTDPSTDTGYWALAAASLPVQVTVTGTTASASANGDYLLTNVAATTVTLPAAPADGDTIMVSVGNGLTTNVVNPNGKNINGEAGNMTINYRYGSVLLRYSATLGDWRTR
jgi:hypothetical protein